MLNVSILAATAPQAPSMWASLMPFLMIFAILYFLMIRPQQKKAKEMQRLLDELKVNDVVITSSGIIGKIITIKADKNIIVLRVDEATNTKIEFQKSAVIGLINEETKA